MICPNCGCRITSTGDIVVAYGGMGGIAVHHPGFGGGGGGAYGRFEHSFSRLLEGDKVMEQNGWEAVKTYVEDQAAQMEEALKLFNEEVNRKIEAAKNNEVLKAIQALNTRLDKIEERLSPSEED